MKNERLQNKKSVASYEKSQTKNNYADAVKAIKEAILISQYEAIKSVNEKQLMLYYAIGKYISLKSRKGFWGTDAIGYISERLQKELPGLKGFSDRNLRFMRTFYEEWSFLEVENVASNATNSILELVSTKLSIDGYLLHSQSKCDFVKSFKSISFTHHRYILVKTKSVEERIFYVNLSYFNHLTIRELLNHIDINEYKHNGKLTNNFKETIINKNIAFRAIRTFKDEYLLDYINTEELNIRDVEDLDERVLENQIVHNIKNFILTFGKGFTFVRNQYHLDAFGENQYIDLLFFNRDLNCLVAIELKTGKFKPAYLGQLSGYLSVLDEYERKSHENQSIGIVLCKDMNKSFVDFVIRDYAKPMGVATYKTSKDMSKKIKDALPDIDELRRLIDKNDN